MVEKVIHRFKLGMGNYWGVFMVIAASAMVTLGYFSPSSETTAFTVMAVAMLSFATVWKLISRLKDSPIKSSLPDKSIGSDLEMVFLFVVAFSVFIQFTGGGRSLFFPIIYALTAFLGAFFHPTISLPALLLAITLDVAGARYAIAGSGSLITYVHSALMVLFYILGYIALRMENFHLKINYSRTFDKEISKIWQDARDFRIIGTSVAKSSRNRADAEQLLSMASVESIHQNLYFLINLIGETMGLTTVVLLWFDNNGKTLKIKEASTESPYMSNGEFDSSKGSIGNIIRNQQPLILGNYGERFPKGSLPYYKGPQEIGSFMGVPVMENGQLRGVLCGDRTNPHPFSHEHLKIFRNGANQIIRILTTERTLHSVEQSKFEQEKFFQASSMLNNALGIKEVLKSAFAAVNSIIPCEEMAMVLIEENSDKLKIIGSTGTLMSSLSDTIIDPKRSLLTIAMENKHYMPINGELRDKKQIVIPVDGIDFSQMGSVLIIPLLTGEKSVGAFILASKERNLFNQNRRDMVGVIADHISVTIQNAVMYQKLETMATTDGLTGLTNHRTFQEKFSEMIARAERTNVPVSLLITDIDKFKNVNDTYGHPVGDIVIKSVASILKDQARNIDLAARYGGEEFAVVLEATDFAGAKIFAERIRQEVESQVYDSSLGPFKTSMSLGIATFPDNGKHKQLLIERADKSLYWAKEHGRNQVVHFSDIS
jgi:diguanylate cyclase (GGDEF)-like protein